VLPVEVSVCHALQWRDFRGDPADKLIAATSIVHQACLPTRDRRLLASKVVPLA
jgi:PIN domain nuclease of toxin-antitoxin system